MEINKFITLVCDLYDLPENVNEFPDNDKLVTTLDLGKHCW